MVQFGYDKYKSRAFRIPQINRWHIVVSGEKLIEELRKAPDEALSLEEALEETLLTRYLVGPTVTSKPYHVNIVRAQLTRNLGSLFPEVRDEIIHAFEDNFPAGDEWTKIPAYASVLQIVARASNRIFVGAPLCRDPDYIALNIKFTVDIAKARMKLMLVPNFLKPLGGMLITNVPKSIQLGLRHLGSMIEERQRKIDEYGLDYPDKPNDFLSWMMDEAEGEERTPERLTNRMLTLNFAAIQTSSTSFTHALFHLAAQPEYIDSIRKEVEAIIAEEGWTKIAMAKMCKLDSFLKESQRFNGLGALTMTRKALKDFTFSDGTHIPKGALVSAASTATHHNEAMYNNSDTFDGFRFSDIREKDGQGMTNQFVATNPDYISFGHGKHACPGRFFAANELKAVMAHLVLNYDIKLENEGTRPPNMWFALQCMPNIMAGVMVRRRQT
ncbi:cytochrome P450 [Ramaria rubella]|nr:cytochrome P450 [Ramaria rubella]